MLGHLDPTKATAAELRGEALFNGKALCASCHPAPAYLDNLMHDLQLERFYVPKVILGTKLTAAEKSDLLAFLYTL